VAKLLNGMAWPAILLMVLQVLLRRWENIHMQDRILGIFVKVQCRMDTTFRDLIKDESGQDIIEYAIVVGLIAMAATATMKTFALSISTAFSQVAAKLTSYTS
jgi:pilus assembly protein Flp/PilA